MLETELQHNTKQTHRQLINPNILSRRIFKRHKSRIPNHNYPARRCANSMPRVQDAVRRRWIGYCLENWDGEDDLLVNFLVLNTTFGAVRSALYFIVYH